MLQYMRADLWDAGLALWGGRRRGGASHDRVAAGTPKGDRTEHQLATLQEAQLFPWLSRGSLVVHCKPHGAPSGAPSFIWGEVQANATNSLERQCHQLPSDDVSSSHNCEHFWISV